MKSKLVEIKDRNITRVEKRYDIITNGSDNAYPTRMERLINSSTTAKSCAKFMAKFIAGNGFNIQFNDDIFIGKNQDGKLTPNDLLKDISHSISRFNAFALHVNYNLNLKITSVAPIAYKYCRYGLSDSDGYSGKVVYYDNWDYSRSKIFRKEDFRKFDVFNPDPTVVQAQIRACGGISKYAGQIFIIKLDNSIYPLSPIDPAQDDADTEYQLSLFKNRTVRKGFVGKKIVTTNEFEDNEDRENFQNSLKSIQGFDSDGDIIHLESEFSGDDKKKQIEIAQLDSDIKTDLFTNWENPVSNNIRRCFNSIPPVLVDFVEGKLGNTSGESFKMAQAYYNSQTAEERAVITRTFKKIFSNYYLNINPSNDWTISQLNLIADGTTAN